MNYSTFRSCLLLGFAILFSSCASPPTSPILPPPGGSPKLFQKYSNKGSSSLSAGWTRGFDMSGVSFNSTRTSTLITPRHVVMAKHFKRKVNAKVIFHDRSGRICVRTLVKVKNCISDVAVGLLDQPVPSTYRAYPLPSPNSNTENLVGRPIAVTDQKKNLFFHEVRLVSHRVLRMTFDKEEKHGWAKRLIKGDSGNPSFLISNNALVLAETHTTGGAGAGPYYGDPEIQESVRQAVHELDPSYSIRVVSVD